jgi:citrate synthase
VVDGLDQIVAAETVLSEVDGQAGRLVIRGYPVEELAARFSAEQATALLLDGFFDAVPTASQIGAARVRVFDQLIDAAPRLAQLELYDGMRAGTALLPDGHSFDDALLLIAAPAVLTPLLLRLRSGERPVVPDPAIGHASDIIRMLHGKPADALPARALDAYLVTVCDHGLNASTFAARVVASTRAGLTSAVLAGLGALKGPLHGGAPGPVIAMLDAIAAHGDPRSWLAARLHEGERLMGFGHRIYRVRDPRADALKAALRPLGQSPAAHERLAFAETVERTALDLLHQAKPNRPLHTNVEFYTALLLEAAGFPPEAFTCLFAAGRTAGWIAHAREQLATGRLIRPQSRYIGPQADLAA